MTTQAQRSNRYLQNGPVVCGNSHVTLVTAEDAEHICSVNFQPKMRILSWFLLSDKTIRHYKYRALHWGRGVSQIHFLIYLTLNILLTFLEPVFAVFRVTFPASDRRLSGTFSSRAGGSDHRDSSPFTGDPSGESSLIITCCVTFVRIL